MFLLNEDHSSRFNCVCQVETKSGEEDEEILFKERAKLYRWDRDLGQWKERGVGDLKILFHPSKHFYRILMRREQVLRVCANHNITEVMELKPMNSSANSLIWTATDYSGTHAAHMMSVSALMTKLNCYLFISIFLLHEYYKQ